jgi:lipoate-protein ligase A
MPAVEPVAAALEQRWNEESLARQVTEPAWRVWLYQHPAIVLGRSQWRLSSAMDPQDKLPVLLRASGGGAVLVGPWMLGLSVALPTDHPLAAGGPVSTYRWLGEAIACALRQIGLEAWAISPDALAAHRAQHTAPAPEWVCFGGLSPWEVLAGKKKIAGLAQVRRRQGILLVAGILMDPPPWELLTRCIGKQAMDAHRLSELTTNCAGFCPGTPIDQIAARLTALLNREIESALTVKSASLLEA